MVFHWSQCDSESLQVSRIFLSILDNLNKLFEWWWFVLQFPTLLSPFLSLWRPFQTYYLKLVLLLLSCSTDFLVLWQSPSNCLSFCFLLFSLCGRPERQSQLYSKFSFLFFFFFFFFFVNYHLVKSSGRVLVIYLYLKIPENFKNLIFQSGYWVVNIPFVRMVKIKLLAQFTVGHLPHAVVSSLIFFLG